MPHMKLADLPKPTQLVLVVSNPEAQSLGSDVGLAAPPSTPKLERNQKDARLLQ